MTNYNPKSIPAQDRMPGRALLNRTECSALRGIAILGIFLHNYLHWLKPMVKENEYQFHQANVDGMMERIMSPSWDILLQFCLLYTSPSPRDLSTSRMPSSA